MGSFLRTRRDRTDPGSIGLNPAGSGRRVPGLRRDELARLAGVSVSYYTRIEQDQVRTASGQGARGTGLGHASGHRGADPSVQPGRRSNIIPNEPWTPGSTSPQSAGALRVTERGHSCRGAGRPRRHPGLEPLRARTSFRASALRSLARGPSAFLGPVLVLRGFGEPRPLSQLGGSRPCTRRPSSAHVGTVST